MTVKSISSIDHIHLQSYIDAISAFNTGEAIQTRKIFQGLWQTFDPTDGSDIPEYDTHQQYRIKPKPKVTIVRFRFANLVDVKAPMIVPESDYLETERRDDFIGWMGEEIVHELKDTTLYTDVYS